MFTTFTLGGDKNSRSSKIKLKK